jgi:hypothetical protein
MPRKLRTTLAATLLALALIRELIIPVGFNDDFGIFQHWGW